MPGSAGLLASCSSRHCTHSRRAVKNRILIIVTTSADAVALPETEFANGFLLQLNLVNRQRRVQCFAHLNGL
ncbi:hypothetical protein A5320_12160 [Rheinheimera sp. SA_1]|nr:hypothetical protein A5320_12160 [Rheinheimera sp. SA_1]